MPNWCNNFVGIRGPKEGLQKLKEAYDNQEFCNAVIPVPQSLKDTVAGSLGDPEEQKKLEAQTQQNIAEHGYGNWYDFCVNRWGTKWDIGGDGGADLEDDGTCLTISFDSAWAPPTGVYEALTDQGYVVEACYYESGMGFCGMYTSEYGDDSYDISEMSADEIADTIPAELDDCMGITEGIREYEAMNEADEELYNWVKDGAEKRGLVEQS
jgi:hypothetical protein